MDKELGASASGLLVKEEPSDKTEKKEQSSTSRVLPQKRRWDDTVKAEKGLQSSNSPNLTQTEGSITLKCPHGPCGQPIEIAHFKRHYRFHHRDVSLYLHERGMELSVPLNMDVIEEGQNKCIGIILINPTQESIHKTTPPTLESHDHFWIMASKSKDDDPNTMFWVFSENQNVRCSMRISPDRFNHQVRAECAVSTLEESQSFQEVLDKENCLCIAYKRILDMLEYKHEVLLTITIH